MLFYRMLKTMKKSLLTIIFCSIVMTGFTQSFYWEKIKNTPSEKTSILNNFDKNKYQLFSLNLGLGVKIQLSSISKTPSLSSSVSQTSPILSPSVSN